MSGTKKADHRLVQPRPEHYKQRAREDGVIEDVLCGPYSLEQRNKYFRTHISLYMTRHPSANPSKARDATFQRWRNLVFATIGDEYVPMIDPKNVRDVVKVFKSVAPKSK
jgi:hypothetical protein